MKKRKIILLIYYKTRARGALGFLVEKTASRHRRQIRMYKCVTHVQPKVAIFRVWRQTTPRLKNCPLQNVILGLKFNGVLRSPYETLMTNILRQKKYYFLLERVIWS